MKFTITISDFRPFSRNTLRGFAIIRHRRIEAVGSRRPAFTSTLTARAGSSLPAKPVLDNAGVAKRKPDGKIDYRRRCSQLR